MIDRNSAQWHTIVAILADMVEAGRPLVDSHQSCNYLTNDTQEDIIICQTN